MQVQNSIINFDKVSNALFILGSLDNKMRKDILFYLLENKNSTVGEVYRNLNISQSICSQNLRILRDAGIIGFTKDGRKVYYRVNRDYLSNLAESVNKFTA